MCTLSYLPLDNGFFLVNSRDESPLRAAALQPQILEIDGKKILCPVDTAGNGTWIGANESGRIACLMNGAFRAHIRRSQYRMSRGKITLGFLSAGDADDYFNGIGLDGIEPFTIIIIEPDKIRVFRWNEIDKYREYPDSSKAHNWSAPALYSAETVNDRQKFFYDHTGLFKADKGKLVDWHMDRLPDSPPLLLHRPLVQTISVTTIECQAGELVMTYEDLLAGSHHIRSLPLISA